MDNLSNSNWIRDYILWELSLIKELGFEIDFLNKDKNSNKLNIDIELNSKYFKIPELLLTDNINNLSKLKIKEALNFNKNLIMENFIIPNRLKLPISRNILETYYR